MLRQISQDLENQRLDSLNASKLHIPSSVVPAPNVQDSLGYVHPRCWARHLLIRQRLALWLRVGVERCSAWEVWAF